MGAQTGQLAAGQFYGDVAVRREVNGLILTETRYQADASFPRHLHDLAYFSFLVDGAHLEQISRRELDYRPFAASFHPTCEEHSGMVRRGSRMFVLELDASWLERVPGAGSVPRDGLVLRGVASVELAARLYHEFHLGDASSPLAIESLACELLEAAVRRGDGPAAERPAWLRRVEELLHEEALEGVGLARVAAEAGVHPMHLARVFRRHHGVSMGGFVRRLKLEAACSLLARPGTSLADVAVQLGFTDQSHFTRTFKAAVGVTPGRFRAAAAARAS